MTYPCNMLLVVSVMGMMSPQIVTLTKEGTPASPSNHKFSIYMKDESDPVALSPVSNMSTQALDNSSSILSPCSCSSNETDSFLAKAHIMMDQMVNKTSMLSKIRHRATHSNEAMWASFTLSGLMVLLVVGVLQSKMWNDRTFISYPDSQPVKFEQFNPKSEILVKELIKSRGRNLVSLFRRRKNKSSQKSTLKMETYLYGERGDTVDSSHKALLESSSEEDNLHVESDSESEEETIFMMNSRTGQWEGEREDDVTKSLLGGRKRNRESTSSTESRFSNSMINSSMAKDLLRLSDSEVEEEKQLINVG